MKHIGGGGIVGLLVAAILGYSLLVGGGTPLGGTPLGSLLEDVPGALIERAKAEAVGLASDALPDGLSDRLPEDFFVPGGAVGADGPSVSKGAPVPPPVAESRQQLAGLGVAPVGSMSGYSREAFPHWSTAAEFGWRVDASCDARDAALIRDGRRVVVGEYCDVERGRWVDPYTGNAYTDPGDMDIDHVVALGNAWRSGASRWTDADREAFANDPAVLLTAEDNANQEKGDKGPEAWVPPNSNYHCFYARHWISIKSDYALTANPAEKGALREMLATCA